MRAYSYFPALLLLSVCGARAQRDFGWGTDGVTGDGLADFQTGTKQSSEYYADTDKVDRSHNGTCFCLRETLVLREEAHPRSAAVATVELRECVRFNGRKALAHGDLWYEMQLLEGTQLESHCKPIGCHWDVTSDSCGYFQIKKNYWDDCGQPGGDWKKCADDMQCSSLCVQNYMARYAKHYGCPMDCEGFAREHNGGPRGCKRASTEKYWDKLQKLPGCRGVKLWADFP